LREQGDAGQDLTTGEAMELSIRPKIEGAKQFLREVKTELKKVTWPTPKQTLASTAVVIILVFVVSFILGIIDFALAKAVKFILG
jgi:preprotein translocase subunit SecE